MYKTKSNSGKNNLCGDRIKAYRLKLGHNFSQKKLADKMQIYGVDIDKNAIQRIEAGQRYVNDFELVTFCKIFNVTLEELCDFNG
ncbi:MAG: helix-turn-helix domain-containing protein [Eubacterium sp.]